MKRVLLLGLGVFLLTLFIVAPVLAAPIIENFRSVKGTVTYVNVVAYAGNKATEIKLNISEFEKIDDFKGFPNSGDKIIILHKNTNFSEVSKISKGDFITAVISLSGDEWGERWFARDIKVIQDQKEGFFSRIGYWVKFILVSFIAV